MKKVSNNNKREILSFEKKTISDLRSERVQGGSSVAPAEDTRSTYRC